MPENTKENLLKKINVLIKAVGAVPKSGKNLHFGYSYRRHEDITNKLQPALVTAGLVIVPKQKKMLINEPGYVLMEATYEITDGIESLEFVGIGEGADKSKDGRPGDKAAYKAQTGAMKYALNDLLLLAGEDPEEDNQTHSEKSTGKPNVAPPQSKTAAQTPRNVLTDDGKSAMVDAMNAMGWDARKQELAFQRAEIIGEQPALEAIMTKYKEYTASKEETNA